MKIYHVVGYTNMVPNALSWYADLITSIVIDTDLLLRIHNSQEVAAGQL